MLKHSVESERRTWFVVNLHFQDIEFELCHLVNSLYLICVKNVNYQILFSYVFTEIFLIFSFSRWQTNSYRSGEAVSSNIFCGTHWNYDFNVCRMCFLYQFRWRSCDSASFEGSWFRICSPFGNTGQPNISLHSLCDNHSCFDICRWEISWFQTSYNYFYQRITK